MDTNQTYLIDGTDGSSIRVDNAGNRSKKYFNYVTGSSNFIIR